MEGQSSNPLGGWLVGTVLLRRWAVSNACGRLRQNAYKISFSEQETAAHLQVFLHCARLFGYLTVPTDCKAGGHGRGSVRCRRRNVDRRLAVFVEY